MANSATIVHVKPGQIAPKEYLEVVRTQCPTAFGFAGRENGKLVCETMPKQITMAELDELQKSFKDEDLVMYFGNLPNATLPDDIQPWGMNYEVEGEKEPKYSLLMFFEGMFDKYSDIDKKHTAEYNASNEMIFPRLSKAWTDADADFPKFFELLRGSALQTTLSTTFDKRGSFVLMPEEGDLICFGNNDLGGQFEWGETTNLHGWVEKATAPAKTEPKKVVSWLRGGTKTYDHNTHQEVPAKEEPAKEPAKPEKDKTGLVQVFPPPKLQKGSARNLWLRTFNGGALPPNHESSQCSVWVRPELEPLAREPAETKQHVQELMVRVSKLSKEKQADVKAAAKEEPAKEEVKPITSAKSTTRDSATNYLPVMTDVNISRSVHMLAQFLDPKNEKRPSGTEIQSMESKWPVFSSNCGIKYWETFGLTTKQISDLVDGNQIAVCQILEHRKMAIELGKRAYKCSTVEQLIEAMKEEEAAGRATKVTADAKAAAELAKETLVPAGKKSWLRGNAA